MAKARPWWERKQAVDVAEAARAAGFTVSVRLGGLLEITETGGTKPVMDARFSFASGALARAMGRTPDGKHVSFDRGGVYTSREMTDSVTEWFRLGRPGDDPQQRMREAMVRKAGLVPEVPPTREHEELAVVTPILRRRKS